MRRGSSLFPCCAGNNAYIGNHIDNVWFSQKIPPASTTKPYFTVTKTVRGDLSEARAADAFGSADV